MSGAVALSNRLPALAAETAEADVLAEIAERIRQHIRRTTAEIIAIGRDLIYVKEKLGHGGFLQWLDHEFLLSSRTARNYIAAAQWAEGKSETVAKLPPCTVYLLAAPSTPDSFKQKVIEDLEAGRRLNPAALEQLVKEERHLERDRKRRNERRRKLARRSKGAIRKAEQAEQRWRDHWARVEALQRERQAEVLSILAKLPPEDYARILELLPDTRLQYWRDVRDGANTGEPRNDDAGAPVEQPADPEDDPFYIPPFLDRRKELA